MRRRQVIAALAILAAAAGCSSGSSSGGGATTTTVVAMRCSPAVALLTSVLASGLRQGGGLSLGKVTVVRSADRANAYFVAAAVTGPKVHATGLWVSTVDTGSGPLFAVNDVARRASVWKDAGKTAHPYAVTDAGARFALRCP